MNPVSTLRFRRATGLLAAGWALLAVGLVAYALRFVIFAYLPGPLAVIPALALHGVCFGCFLFVAFMVVDEETSSDVRASAQSLFNVVVVGIGIIAGNWFAGWVAKQANGAPEGEPPVYDYGLLFGIPMWIALG